MRVQSRILICQICVRNVVILVSEINGGAAAGCEQLHTTTKLSGKVELLSGSKHPMVEVKEPPTAGEKWFDPVEMHEVYLRTDRAAPDTVGVGAVTIVSMRVADERYGD